jgi:hypothetical protein
MSSEDEDRLNQIKEKEAAEVTEIVQKALDIAEGRAAP